MSPDVRAEKSRNFRSLLPLLAFARPYRAQMALGMVALVAAAGLMLAIPQGVRVLIDEAFATHNPAVLHQALLLLVGLVTLMSAAVFVRARSFLAMGDKVVADIRKAAFAHVMTLSPAFFETRRTGEIISRLQTDVTLLALLLDSVLPVALRSALQLLGGLVLLVATSPRLTLVVLLVVPLVMGLTILFGRRVRTLSRALQDRTADLSTHIEETVAAVRTVQAFDQQTREVGQFAASADTARDIALQRGQARAAFFAVVLFCVFNAIGAVLWVGGTDVLEGRMSPGDLTAFLIYAIMVATSVGGLSEMWSSVQVATGATERLFDLLATPPDLTDPAQPKTLPTAKGGRAVRFDKVSFAYPSRPEVNALDGVSFALQPGETVAIVGPSGAGKSTLFHLLMRFYDPASGVLSVDGVPLTDLRRTDLRRAVATVAQDPAIFAASAADNIRYGRPDATDAQVQAAAELAQADGFIRALPQGYDTFLGERGVRLSGGQRQRVAIARTFLRGPDVLLLDEATSSLDAESESLIQQALAQLVKGRTTLIIAHRLSTVRAANRILVLDKGRLVAEGPHNDLLATSPLYARLASLQFLDH